MRVPFRSANEADEGQFAPGHRRALPGVFDGGNDFACRVHVRAVAQHDVEQDDRRLGVVGLFRDALISQAMVNHRMRAAAREHIIAEVDQRMRLAVPHVVEPQGPADRCVGIDRRKDLAEKQRGLEAESAAAIEPADILLSASELRSVCEPFPRLAPRRLSVGQGGGKVCGVFKRTRTGQVVALDGLRIDAEKANNDWLSRCARLLQHSRCDSPPQEAWR